MYQRKSLSFFFGILIVAIFPFTALVCAQTKQNLPRTTPEAECVSSAGILNFLKAAADSKIEFHSMMILRNGKVIAEGWWNPYRPDLKHTMYSVSKSWTSSAIGFAVSEKLLTVDDKVISFFPDQLPDTVSDHLKELRIKHLLSMTVGHNPDPTFNIVSQEDDWVKGFLSRTVEHKPGTKFLYNTTATYMLSAIIQKVTGKKVIDYLKPRLFDPLGITDVDSEVDPKGINTGGWGMRLRTEDMAKFGQLYLQRGKWNDRQILPESWIEEATSSHIEQAPHVTQTVKDSSDWLQGYGYQFWRTRHNAYRADGAYGQFIVMLPEKNMVIVLTAETPDMQRQINLVWEHILPAVQDGALPTNKSSTQKLNQQLRNLTLSVPVRGVATTRAKDISKKRIILEANDFDIEAFSFSIKGDKYQLTIKTKTEAHNIDFGSGVWALGETKKHGPYLLAAAKAKFVGLPAFKVAGAYSWTDANTLELTLRYIESPHTEKFTLRLDQDNVIIEVVHSLNPAATVTILGKLQ